ncbi:MAG: hypothetical protein KF701_04125 [Anaerolineales bacterium]|nr:MAG: hypothetical protein KF701_04125 [Anaerolineales bacterium]
MLVLLPVVLLIVTLLALVGLQRWRPAFKSYWFVAMGGALAAALVVLGLRFSLPQAASFPGWRLAEGLEFPFTLVLDQHSWPLALTLLVLLLAHLLGSVRRASGVSWPIWMPALAAAGAGLLAITAGDLLAAALTLFLLDILLYALHSSVAPEGRAAALLEQFAFNAGSVLLVLAAWATPPSYAGLAAIFLIAAGAMRLAVASGPHEGTSQPMPAFVGMLRAAPLAATLALLQRGQPLSGIMLHIGLFVTLLVVLRAGLRSLSVDAPVHSLYQCLAALALAAAMAGAPSGVLAFGLMLLFANGIVRLAARYPRARLPLLAAAALLLCGLWFTATQGIGGLYIAPVSPLVFVFLPVHAIALLALLQRSTEPVQPPEPDEPWTLAVESIGTALPAAMLLVLGLLLPTAGQGPLWAGPVVLGLLAVFWVARRQLQRSGRSLLPPHLRLPQVQPPAARRVAAALSTALGGGLRLFSSLLEGEAGLLWALLVIALLISIASQSGLAGG